MAIVQNTLIGRARRSVGGTTFATWNGLNILKAKILKPKPQTITDAVILNRAKMKLVGQSCAFISPFAKSIYRLGTPKTTGFAEIVKFFRNKITGAVGSLKLLVTDLVNTSFGSENTGGIFYTSVAKAGRLVTLTLVSFGSNPLLLNGFSLVNVCMVNESCTRVVYHEHISDGSHANFDVPCAEFFAVGEKVFCYINAEQIVDGGTDLICSMHAQNTVSLYHIDNIVL